MWARPDRLHVEPELRHVAVDQVVEGDHLALLKPLCTSVSMTVRVHEIVRATAPKVALRLWYEMPPYGRAAVFVQTTAKLTARNATLGSDDLALLDGGTMPPTVVAITTLDDEAEARVRKPVVRAAG